MLTLFHAPQSRSSRMIWLLEELAVGDEVTIRILGPGDCDEPPHIARRDAS